MSPIGSKTIPRVVSVREAIDTSIYREALEGLITKEPENKFYREAFRRFQKTSELAGR